MNRSLHLSGLRFSLCFFSAILLVGCERKPQEVNVQVFIVTKGSENVKLGLTEVKAIPLEKAKEALRPALTKRDSELAALKTKIETAEDNQKRGRKWKEKQLAEAQAQATNSSQVADKALEIFHDAVKKAVAAAEQKRGAVDKYATKIDEVFGDGDDSESDAHFYSSWEFTYSGVLDNRANNTIKIMAGNEWQALPINRAAIIQAAQNLKSANEQAIIAFKKENMGIGSRGESVPLSPTTTNAINAASAAMKAYKSSIDAVRAAALSYKNTTDKTVGQGLSQDSMKLDSLTVYSADEDRIPNADKAIEIVGHEHWNGLLDYRAAVLKASAELKTSAQQKMADASEVSRLKNLPQSDTVSDLYAEREQVRSADNLIAALPTPTFSVKTDADGKCRLLLPHDQRWVLTASGTRHLAGDKKEEYTWIVEVPEDKAASVSLLLSNDNLLDNGRNPLGM